MPSFGQKYFDNETKFQKTNPNVLFRIFSSFRICNKKWG